MKFFEGKNGAKRSPAAIFLPQNMQSARRSDGLPASGIPKALRANSLVVISKGKRGSGRLTRCGRNLCFGGIPRAKGL